MRYYDEDVASALRQLDSSPDGLTSAEADKRLQTLGLNKLDEPRKDSLVKRFVAQLNEPMTIILLVSALVSALTSLYAGEGFADTIIILLVVALNAALGVFQESKAEKAIEALQSMTAATCKVTRDRRHGVIEASKLVPGDIIILEAGDAVPADARIIESAALKIEEAALTGESVPVNKAIAALGISDGREIALGDRRNMCYTGSTVVYGRGRAVVCETGMRTEMGKIAAALATTREGQTPLQRKLSQLGKTLSKLVLGVCVFIFAFSLLRAGAFSLSVVLSTFMVAVSLAVAAVPEGLTTVVTLVLSIGVTRMSKRNAVIRRLTAVETLGCAQVICSDKTGTLTQNRMTVVSHQGETGPLAVAMTLCSDAVVGANERAEGEPTECALVNFATDEGFNKTEFEALIPRVGEAPFDSERKMMTTLHMPKGAQLPLLPDDAPGAESARLHDANAGIVQFTKGAPDEVLKRCTHIWLDGRRVPLDDSLRADVLGQNKAYADQALRVLAAATRRYPSLPPEQTPEALETGMTFLGLCGMIDPIRPEVKPAMDECRTAGIRPVMITGDHRDTAVAIARELGILTDENEAVTGAEIDDLDAEALKTRVRGLSVYARVQPEHKTRIVKAWQDNGCVVAMTGDGVNDAPSIKAADIGVGMGITGTDVTKNVADMVLADDNFATIVHAVEEGRRIYDNIRKAVQFLLASNMSEVVGIFAATLLGFTLLKPVHLLWINLITDTFPALALGMEPAQDDLMRRKPRDSRESVFADGVGRDIAYQGVLIALITLCAFFVGHFMESGVWAATNSGDGTTMAFLTMSMAEIFHCFNMRARRESVFRLKKQNAWLWGSMLGSLALTTAVLYIPFLANAFGFAPISVKEYLVAMGLALCVIPIVECVKAVQRAAQRRKQL